MSYIVIAAGGELLFAQLGLREMSVSEMEWRSLDTTCAFVRGGGAHLASKREKMSDPPAEATAHAKGLVGTTKCASS